MQKIVRNVSFALLLLAGCSVQRTYWQANTAVGFQADKSGDLKRAETELRLALWRAQTHLGAEEVSSSLLNLGIFYLKHRHTPHAIPLFNESLAIEEKLSGLESERTARRLAYLADAYQLERNFNAGRPIAKRLALLVDKFPESDRVFVRKILDEYRDKPEEWAKELARLEPLARNNDAQAQFELAIHYDLGQGVPANPGKAVELYLLAAHGGYLDAQYYVGVIYDKARGVPQNDQEARRWYALAAERGHPIAQYNYAVFWLNGRGGATNKSEAIGWLWKSSAQGYFSATQLLTSLDAK